MIISSLPTFPTSSFVDKYQNYRDKVNSLKSSSVSGITSRDQIINPYELLDISMYGNGADARTLYESDLNALLNIQSQQIASYEEWYNSAEQQALREIDANRNPALSDISAGDAASSEIPSSSPYANVPTDEEISAQRIASLTSVLTSVAQVASLPGTIGQSWSSINSARAATKLTNVQKDSLNLANIKEFEGLVYSNASGRLADAIASSAQAAASFDFDSWFKDPSNFEGIFEAYAPSDHPSYRAAYDRAIQNVQRLKGSAYAQNSSTLNNQSSFAKGLADPYFDDDLLLQVACYEPLMNAYKDIQDLQNDFNHYVLSKKKHYATGIDTDAAIDAANKSYKASSSEYKYKTDYFNNFDGDDSAAYDMMLKKAQAIRENCRSVMESNLTDIYNDRPNTYVGLRACSMVLGGTPLAYDEWLLTYGITQPSKNPRSNPSRASEIHNNTDADTWLQENTEGGWMID